MPIYYLNPNYLDSSYLVRLLLFAAQVPVMGGVALFVLNPGRKLRTAVVSGALLIQTTFVILLSLAQMKTTMTMTFSLGTLLDLLPISFRVDRVGCFFAVLFACSGLLIVLYAFRYMSREQAENRFFGCWLIASGVLTALCFANNLLTFYLFYELMTLATLPLVLHEMTHRAIMAGLKYLFYSIGGALLALLGIMYLYRFDQSLTFQAGGFMQDLAADPAWLQTIAFLMICGFCCKAGMFPLHGWLPTAHPEAPAPASALLSGCITKCGVLGVIRVVYYTAGAELLRGSWVQRVWMALALLTVFLGSMMAYLEPVMKKRLAYSTVSQLSYILFGLSLLNGEGLAGALLQTVFHMVTKIGLFLCAGAIIYETGRTRMSDLRGLGRGMPSTCLCWAGLSLSLVGIPPFAGFTSKWMLAEGALASDMGIFRVLGPAVLLISALLTAGYLFLLPVRGFFPEDDFLPEAHEMQEMQEMLGMQETHEKAQETQETHKNQEIHENHEIQEIHENHENQEIHEIHENHEIHEIHEIHENHEIQIFHEAELPMLAPIAVTTLLALALGVVTRPLFAVIASVMNGLL